MITSLFLLICVLIASMRLSTIMQGAADGWTWLGFVYFTLLGIVHAWLLLRRRESGKG